MAFALLLSGMVLNAHANLSYELLQSLGDYVALTIRNACVLAVLCVGTFVLCPTTFLLSAAGAWLLSQALFGILMDARGLNVIGASVAGTAPFVADRVLLLLPLISSALWAGEILPAWLLVCSLALAIPAVCRALRDIRTRNGIFW
jgi:hypothetical protein